MTLKFCIISWIGCVISFFILIRELIDVIRYRSKYFASKFVQYPKELYSGEYEHSFACLKTGVNIHYVSCGDKTKPLMLFVHGFPEFWYSWRHQMEYFKADYWVVALDMRGYGLSDKPANVDDYAIKNLVADVYELYQHLGKDKMTLVAHDWGGVVAYRYAAEHADTLNSLITMNIAHGDAFERVFKKSFKQNLMSWYIFFFQVPFLPEWILTKMGCQKLGEMFSSPKLGGLQLSKASDTDIQAFRANFCIPGAANAAINYYRSAIRSDFATKKGDPMTVKRNIPSTLPCLLIWGDKDIALSTELAIITKEIIPTLKLHFVPGASHWVQQDAPDVVNSTMQNFLKS